VRRPTPDGTGRTQEVRQYRTFTAALRELRAWLLAERVTQVAMEATGSYWKPVWHVRCPRLMCRFLSVARLESAGNGRVSGARRSVPQAGRETITHPGPS
jgi:hypothetical protein